MSEPRYKKHPYGWLCEDCGVLVLDAAVHTRFHSILGGHAWALAVLKTAHVSANVHDRYEVPDRIDSKKFDNWSADALANGYVPCPRCRVRVRGTDWPEHDRLCAASNDGSTP